MDQPVLFSSVRRSLCCYETKWHTTWYFMPRSENIHCLPMLLGNLSKWQQDIRSPSPAAGGGSALTIAFSWLTCSLCKTHVYVQRPCWSVQRKKCECPSKVLTFQSPHCPLSDLCQTWGSLKFKSGSTISMVTCKWKKMGVDFKKAEHPEPDLGKCLKTCLNFIHVESMGQNIPCRLKHGPHSTAFTP